jgi:hypothetical protein
MDRSTPASEVWTSADFAAWLARMRLSHAGAARELGLTKRMVTMYVKGEHPTRKDAAGAPAPVVIPRAIALACSALEIGPMSILRRATTAK